MTSTKSGRSQWKKYGRALWRSLRCSFVDKIVLTHELKSHYLEACRQRKAIASPVEILGEPQELAADYNKQFRSQYRAYAILSIPLTCVIAFCVFFTASYYLEEWTFKLGGVTNAALPELPIEAVVGCAVRGTQHHEKYGFGVYDVVWAQGLTTYPWDEKNDRWTRLPCFDRVTTLGQKQYLWATEQAVVAPIFPLFEAFPPIKSAATCQECNPALSSQAALLMVCEGNPLCVLGETHVMVSISTNYRELEYFLGTTRNHYVSEVVGIASNADGRTRTFATDYRSFGDEYGEPATIWLALGFWCALAKFMVWIVFNLRSLVSESVGRLERLIRL